MQNNGSCNTIIFTLQRNFLCEIMQCVFIDIKTYILWKTGTHAFFHHICLRINRIFYELTLSLSYEYALVTAHNISILIRAAHCRWAEVCVFILLYFLVTCTLVNNGCWQVDRACFFYQEKKFTKHTKCIYIDVWIDVWRLAITFSFCWDDPP